MPNVWRHSNIVIEHGSCLNERRSERTWLANRLCLSRPVGVLLSYMHKRWAAGMRMANIPSEPKVSRDVAMRDDQYNDVPLS